MLVQDVLTSLRVSLGTQNAVFKAAVGTRNEISVTGTVKGGAPCLTRIGTFDVDLLMEGIVLLVRQVCHLSSAHLMSHVSQHVMLHETAGLILGPAELGSGQIRAAASLQAC